MLIIGHRGCAGIEPENTLKGIKRAMDIVDRIEIDVRTCKSGEPILMHDPNTKRVTSKSRWIENTDLDEIKKLRIKGEQIPTLEEALRLIRKKKPINLELKDWNSKEEVLRLIQKYSDAENILITSSVRKGLLNVNGEYEGDLGIVTLGVNPFVIKWMKKQGIHTASIMYPFARRRFVEGCHMHGKKVYIYPHGPSMRMNYQHIQRLGADGGFFNYPGRKSF